MEINPRLPESGRISKSRSEIYIPRVKYRTRFAIIELQQVVDGNWSSRIILVYASIQKGVISIIDITSGNRLCLFRNYLNSYPTNPIKIK